MSNRVSLARLRLVRPEVNQSDRDSLTGISHASMHRCSLFLSFSKAMWMRIRPPHNPDILTYRDSVVYAPDRIHLEQRRLSSSTNANGTLIDTYFLTLTILRPNIEDEGRYLCSRGKTFFAEYDLFIIGKERNRENATDDVSLLRFSTTTIRWW